MDIGEAMVLLHEAKCGFSYDVDPARYTINQADLPKLFDYIINQAKEGEKAHIKDLIWYKEFDREEMKTVTDIYDLIEREA